MARCFSCIGKKKTTDNHSTTKLTTLPDNNKTIQSFDNTLDMNDEILPQDNSFFHYTGMSYNRYNNSKLFHTSIGTKPRLPSEDALVIYFNAHDLKQLI
ncbi:hypothetical protein I4U23_029067 [Adineta vaga]|nr:hypothetical protein I4U23_029067 [Adineta vaga]